MDATITTATKRATELRRRIDTFTAKKREVESGHARERAALAQAEETRLALVKELADADAATEGWAHGEIDKLDSQIVVLTRKTSALGNALKAIEVELEPFATELREVEQTIQAEQRAEALRVFQSKMEHAVKTASGALANARERLADLNRLAAEGVEMYADAGLRIVGPVVEEFVLGEANLDVRGWKPSRPVYTRLEFVVRSMTRG